MERWLSHLAILTDHPLLGAAVILLGSLVAAWLVEAVALQLLSRLTARTSTVLDDQLLLQLRRPIRVSVVLFGAHHAVLALGASGTTGAYASALLQTLAIVVWGVASLRVGGLVLRHLARVAKPTSIVQARSQPVFDIILKTMVIGSGAYLFLVAWGIDIGAWLASAGIVGIAVGFAARDSLANYFAGVFIIADAPYKLGDIIVLDEGTRGRVTDIGLRSTRILTRDEIEINIPNSILGNMKVVNASAGPTPHERVAVHVSVAYGTKVEDVIELLRAVVPGTPNVATDREPQVQFMAMGDSGLELRLLVWAEDPAAIDAVRHELTLRAYNTLCAAGIEIPYPKRDVYVRGLPTPIPVG